MPMYDYACPSCNHEFEKNVKIANYQEPQPCPECGGMADRMAVKTAPSLGDPVRLGLLKPPEGFREVLRNIHTRNHGSVLKENSSFI